MSKTTYVAVPAEFEDAYNNTINPGDRFVFPRMKRKKVFFGREAIKKIAGRSLLKSFAETWGGLTAEQKALWTAAGAIINSTGWRTFVSDTAARMKGGFTGIATPATTHQANVGLLRIEAPASEIKIEQHHPRSFYIKQKVAGTKNMYSPVLITEDFALPLEIGFSYKSNLSASGGNPYAYLYATVYSTYQGEVQETDLVIELDLVADWQTVSDTLLSVLGDVVWYKLVIHLHDVTGDLYFDNVVAEHSGQNWARDWKCVDIDAAFTRAYYQVSKSWLPEIVPDGSFFGSVYPE